MVLNNSILDDLKERSGLLFDHSKDFGLLAEQIFQATGRTIGLTTLKRMLGYIDDARKTNEYTLNTIALYLGFESWSEYMKTKRINSEWGFSDESMYTDSLALGTKVMVRYLNREVTFVVSEYGGVKVMKVISAENSSLQVNDILFLHEVTVGEPLIAEKVIRGTSVGNYKTNGEVSIVKVIEP
jgi:hypothetical protein